MNQGKNTGAEIIVEGTTWYECYFNLQVWGARLPFQHRGPQGSGMWGFGFKDGNWAVDSDLEVNVDGAKQIAAAKFLYNGNNQRATKYYFSKNSKF